MQEDTVDVRGEKEVIKGLLFLHNPPVRASFLHWRSDPHCSETIPASTARRKTHNNLAYCPRDYLRRIGSVKKFGLLWQKGSGEKNIVWI
jgi:hypothetical protein